MSRGTYRDDYRVQIQLPREAQAWINAQRRQHMERYGSVISVSEVIEAAIWKVMAQ